MNVERIRARLKEIDAKSDGWDTGELEIRITRTGFHWKVWSMATHQGGGHGVVASGHDQASLNNYVNSL